MPGYNYSNLSKVQFTDEDVAAVADASGTKPLASLFADNFLPAGEIEPAVLITFAKLASLLGSTVSRDGNGLTVVRAYTEEETRDAALQTLRYGYTDEAREIRDQRAAKQGIEIYRPEGEA